MYVCIRNKIERVTAVTVQQKQLACTLYNKKMKRKQKRKTKTEKKNYCNLRAIIFKKPTIYQQLL